MILLARHGQTDDSLPPVRVAGRIDTPLNAEGERQAAALAESLADAGIVSLLASPLLRARRTAEIVGARLGLPVAFDERFVESDRGRWQGMTVEEIAREDPDDWAAFQAGEPDFRFPGGESLAEHQDRVVAALVDVTQSGRLPALVVCHGGTISVARCHTQQRGLRAYHDWDHVHAQAVVL